MDEPKPCALCGDPIEDGEAWMTDDSDRRAHSGCVYRDEERDARAANWAPGEYRPPA